MLNRRSNLVTSLATCALAAALVAPGVSFAAPNWSLPGISLQELVDGGSFASDDGSLSFTDFSASVSGVRLRSLDLYRVLPTEQGFELLAPLFAGTGETATLDLDYSVTPGSGLEIDSAAVSFLGFALGRDGSSGVEMDLLDGGGVQHGALIASRQGFFGPGDRDDATGLDPALAFLRVQERVHATAGELLPHVGFAATLAVGHQFGTAAVPEPGTALLLGLGMGGLALAGRRRATIRDESGT